MNKNAIPESSRKFLVGKGREDIFGTTNSQKDSIWSEKEKEKENAEQREENFVAYKV